MRPGYPMQQQIIYTADQALFSKRNDTSWREIQDEHEHDKTSLGPWGPEAVIEYLAGEYPVLHPPAAVQVEALVAGSAHTLEVTLRAT